MQKFSELEEKWLAYWYEHKVFEKSLAKPAPSGRFVFFEGPPTANGQPGLHHVLARAFKDLIPRYKTMRGFHVERKAGWDTQGLPVELQVEKALKFRGKMDIEKYGVAEFNAKCREDVWKYKEDWEKLTRRMGYWLDLEHPYITYERPYIESLWWIFKQIHESGLLYQDYKVLPHCPRCATALSSHEVAQGYQEIKDRAVYVKFKVKPGQPLGTKREVPNNTYILSWTTTPWTLPGNVALAVGREIEYIMLHREDNHYILARELVEKIFPDFNESDMSSWEQIAALDKEVPLADLLYDPLFDIKPLQNDKSHRVYEANFVTTDEGTGVVHTAVMYGEDDFNLGTREGLPKHHTVDENGKFTADVPQWVGKFVRNKQVEQEIIDYLTAQGREGHSGLFGKPHEYTHDYPFCWRCESPLLYYAKPSWFIKMSSLRDELKDANEQINWYPEHIKHGRFGEWLEGVKDWAISRERYWGTPLPIWVCSNKACGHQVVVGSLPELSEKSGQKFADDFDPHRPGIDEVVWICKKCGGKGEMRRVTEVADCWFDSGSMPFAQWGYPHAAGSKEQLVNSYPADYIAEAIDQTRGWFYTLLAVATLLKKAGAIKEVPPYKNVICLGHINDAKGQKMSKSKGNIIDPWEMIEKFGIDAVRLHLFTVNQPGEPKNFDPNDVDSVVKKTFLILMNVVTFYELYEDKAEASRVAPKTTNVLDRWALSLWHQTTGEVTQHLDNYQVTEAARKLADFVTELSTWYVRRSRERFKVAGLDKGLALTTLGYILRELAITLAPFTPFVAEEVYQRVKGGLASVHLEDWPEIGTVDEKILDEMEKGRTVVEQALAERAKAGQGFSIRQVLNSFSTTIAITEDIKGIVAAEINVKEIVHGDKIFLNTTLDDNLRAEGLTREFVRQVNALRKKQGLTIKDRVLITVCAPAEVRAALDRDLNNLANSVLASDVKFVAEQQPYALALGGVSVGITR